MGSQQIKCIDNQSGYVFASGYAYWTTGSKTIEIELDYCGVSTWRIRGLSSQGDSKAYLTVTSGGLSGSFEVSDTSGSKGYILQVYDGATYFNSDDGSGTFYPFSDDSDDDDDEGGGSGGSGGDSTTPYTLFVNIGEGTQVTVYRTWSDDEDNRYDYLVKNATEATTAIVYYNDRFEITAKALSGYEIDYYNKNPFYTENLSQSTSSSGTVRYGLKSYDNAFIYTTATLKSYKLSATADTGAYITVTRTASKKSDAPLGVLSNGATIYHYDTLEVSVGTEAGYDIVDTIVSGCTENDDGTFTVTGDVNVSVTTKLMGLVYIYDGTSFVPCLIYIDNGVNWLQCMPYVDNGTSWNLCS